MEAAPGEGTDYGGNSFNLRAVSLQYSKYLSELPVSAKDRHKQHILAFTTVHIICISLELALMA